MDAFAFVQECIGAAADAVHGPLSEAEMKVARWMAKQEVELRTLRMRYDAGDLPPDITKALRQMGGCDRMNRHVTGQQLCWAIRDTALSRWGLMARGVLARWNITTTEDIGNIIFALVESGWLQKQPTDTLGDFDHVFDFAEAFDRNYQIG